MHTEDKSSHESFMQSPLRELFDVSARLLDASPTLGADEPSTQVFSRVILNPDDVGGTYWLLNHTYTLCDTGRFNIGLSMERLLPLKNRGCWRACLKHYTHSCPNPWDYPLFTDHTIKRQGGYDSKCGIEEKDDSIKGLAELLKWSQVCDERRARATIKHHYKIAEREGLYLHGAGNKPVMVKGSKFDGLLRIFGN